MLKIKKVQEKLRKNQCSSKVLSKLCPPQVIKICLKFFQAGMAYGKLFPVFHFHYIVMNGYDMNQVHDTSSFRKNEIIGVQSGLNLSEAAAFFDSAVIG